MSTELHTVFVFVFSFPSGLFARIGILRTDLAGVISKRDLSSQKVGSSAPGGWGVSV